MHFHAYFHTETDFNNEAIITTIPAGSGTADHHINIEINDDNIQEQDEAFLLYMEVVGSTTQQIEIIRNVSVLRIRDNDSKSGVCHHSCSTDHAAFTSL